MTPLTKVSTHRQIRNKPGSAGYRQPHTFGPNDGVATDQNQIFDKNIETPYFLSNHRPVRRSSYLSLSLHNTSKHSPSSHHRRIILSRRTSTDEGADKPNGIPSSSSHRVLRTTSVSSRPSRNFKRRNSADDKTTAEQDSSFVNKGNGRALSSSRQRRVVRGPASSLSLSPPAETTSNHYRSSRHRNVSRQNSTGAPVDQGSNQHRRMRGPPSSLASSLHGSTTSCIQSHASRHHRRISRRNSASTSQSEANMIEDERRETSPASLATRRQSLAFESSAHRNPSTRNRRCSSQISDRERRSSEESSPDYSKIPAPPLYSVNVPTTNGQITRGIRRVQSLQPSLQMDRRPAGTSAWNTKELEDLLCDLRISSTSVEFRKRTLKEEISDTGLEYQKECEENAANRRRRKSVWAYIRREACYDEDFVAKRGDRPALIRQKSTRLFSLLGRR